MINKKFCIAGPIVPSRNYFVEHRLDQNEMQTLIDDAAYFVLHAPRQSGKTTAIEEVIGTVNKEGKYLALYINIEPAQAARDTIEKALIVIVNQLALEISDRFPEYDALALNLRQMTEQCQIISLTFLLDALELVCRSIKKPVVLFIDEIDSLIGDSLLSVLRQIRAGFKKRPKSFPQSICLVGLRDVRDYIVWSKEHGQYVSTSCPFNIKTISLRLANFSQDDLRALYLQHTAATGQQFTEEALECAFFLTQGQPWLVNALAQEACFALVLDRTRPITKEVIEQAKDILIARRDTHIDSLLRSSMKSVYQK